MPEILLAFLLPVSIFIIVISIVGLIVVFKMFGNQQEKNPEPEQPTIPQKDLPSPPVDKSLASTESIQPTEYDNSTEILPEFPPVMVPTRDTDTRTRPNRFNIRETIKAQEEAETQKTRLPNMNWQAVGESDVGQKRELNEDSWGSDERLLSNNQPCGIYVVADGMGGHEGGEIASSVTVETILKQFKNNPPDANFENWLKEATDLANQAVIAKQEHQDRPEKMGSTLVMALVVDNQVYIANVGDSRTYLLNEEIIKLTTDHSLVERLVELGQITKEEARTHPQRNVIYSTMGDPEKMHVDTYRHPLNPGDRLLLCSDGLSGMVEDKDLLAISQQCPDPVKATKAMIDAANENGGKDNITAVIVQMDA
jgi:protein phosphatase